MGHRGRVMWAWVAVLVAAAVSPGQAAREGVVDAPVVARFDGHKVLRVNVRTPAELMTTLALTDDVWSHGVGVGPVDVRVTPEQFAAAQAAGLEFEVLIEDVQALVDAEAASIARTRARRDAAWFEDYKTLDEINARMDALAAAHPDKAQTFVVGNSLQGRAIRGIRITGPGNASERPRVIFNGCQHAREWISPMTVMWFADVLLERYESDPRVRGLVDSLEIHLVPVSNPDGYVYTWTNNRLWRKNRRNNGNGTFGVDLNRNWGYQWGGQGSSGSGSEETYRGPAPFSEPETQALRDYIAANGPFVAHIDFHSYSQLILSPWSYTGALPADHATFMDLNGRMESAIEAVHGTQYVSGPGYTTIYPAAGAISDWTYGDQGILAWGFELRDTGQFGFVLPASQIIPTGQETFEGVLALGEYVAQPLAFSFPDGVPEHLTAGEQTAVRVSITDTTGVRVPGSERVWWRYGSAGTFTEQALAPESGTTFVATLPAAACGERVEFYFAAATQGGASATFPLTGAAGPLSATARMVSVLVVDEMETDAGWTVGAPGDGATSGIWGRMDPQPTAAQPGDDHTPAPGVMCWITDGRAGSGVGSYDIDGGATTLTSPRLDARAPAGQEGMEAYLSYWRWYSNDMGAAPGEDSMPVLISGDDGASWVQLELVTENANAWVERTFRIADFVEPTDRVRVRFVARDLGAGSVVEAGVDDLRVYYAGCAGAPCAADMNGDGTLSVADFTAYRAAYLAGDAAADFNGDGELTVADFTAFRSAYLAGCP